MTQVTSTKNNALLQGVEALITQSDDTTHTLLLCQFIAHWLQVNPSSYLLSPVIEEALAHTGSHIPCNSPRITLPKRLLIATALYEDGGHTRIIENILKGSDPGQYDLYVIHQDKPFPPTIYTLTQETLTTLTLYTFSDFQTAATDLRDTALHYRSLLLLTHPQDLTATIAFSHPHWTIPILAYNHGDHLFAVGTSIVDTLLEMSSRSIAVSTDLRQSKHSVLLPLPITPSANPSNKSHTREHLRASLDIPLQAKVILSIGSPYKYTPQKNNSWSEYARQLLTKSSTELFFVIIGPLSTSHLFKKLVQDFPRQIKVLGTIAYQNLSKYYTMADIYMDSMPISGYTTLLEAGASGLPLLALDQGENYPDALLPLLCTKETFASTALQVIKSNHNERPLQLTPHTLEEFITSLESFTTSTISATHSPTPSHTPLQKKPLSTELFHPSSSVQRYPLTLLLSLKLSQRARIAGIFLGQGDALSALFLLLFSQRRFQWFRQLKKRLF